MSFILDALKKSENERQRQTGPALFEVKLAPPRNRLPWWAIGVGALLGVNLVVVAVLLWRSPAAAPAPGAASPPLASGTPDSTQTPTPAPAAAPPAPPQPQLAPPAPTMQSQAAAPAGAARRDGEPDTVEPLLSEDPDEAPAVEPDAESFASRGVTRGTEDGLPSYDQLAAQPGTHLPELHLNVHGYAQRPQDRWVFLNMRKLREGESLPEGVRVDRIDAQGAVLSFRGMRFTLPAP